MKIKIIGAAGGEVTGSAYYVQTKQANVLVDCGLFQARRPAFSSLLITPTIQPPHGGGAIGRLDPVLRTIL